MLVYTSGPLAETLEVTGTVKAVLYAGTSAQDTDIVCRLSDVDETGYAFPLLTGIVCGRFRNGT